VGDLGGVPHGAGDLGGLGGGGGDLATVKILLADALVGAVIGRNGTTISHIQQSTGTRIQVSQRGDMEVGSTDRTFTIQGSHAACQVAQQLIHQRAAAVDQQNQ
jgi:polyribonucleotide nucleotidyltransferase